MAATVYTIGHSTHSLKRFLELLVSNEITALADVRSRPYSRYTPQFNHEALRADLKKAGIAHVFLGRELGARTEDRSCYLDGKARYSLIARTELFQQGLERVLRGTQKHRIALMCAEKDPLTCHRAILVCRHLIVRGASAEHILENGTVESHASSLARLFFELKLDPNDLFRSREDMIAEAYQRRGDEIEYSERDQPSESVHAK